MPDRYTQLEALISGLTDVQAGQKVSGIMSAALREPQSADAQLQQVDRVLAAFQQLGGVDSNDTQNLDLLLTLGRTYDQFAYVDKALQIYQTALGLAERLSDAGARAVVLRRIGKAQLRLRRWDEALETLDKSLGLYRTLGDGAGQARVLMNRGIALQELGNYAEAETVYLEAVELAGSAEDLETVADAESNLAVLATVQGNLDDAVARYQACLARFEAQNNVTGLARTYHNLGMAQADREDWREAMRCYEKAFDIAHEAGLLDVVANVYLSRAELMLELGDTSMSATCCALALDIYRKTSDALGEADSYRLLGLVFTKRRQWATAETLFQDSYRLNLEFENPLNAAETQRDLGKMYALRGQRMKAEEALTHARDAFDRLGAKADVVAVDGLLKDLDDSGAV